jgi:hypothetical protein
MPDGLTFLFHGFECNAFLFMQCFAGIEGGPKDKIEQLVDDAGQQELTDFNICLVSRQLALKYVYLCSSLGDCHRPPRSRKALKFSTCAVACCHQVGVKLFGELVVAVGEILELSKVTEEILFH